jgi:hypothetical protein
MTYYIFLKSLRILEEFRKNPHIKIPPKSLCTNFQSLGKLKKSNFYSKKIFSSDFGPVSLAAPPACSAYLAQPAQPAFFSLPVLTRQAPPSSAFRRLPAPPQPRPPWSHYPELCTASVDCFPSSNLHSMNETSFKCEPFHPH